MKGRKNLTMIVPITSGYHYVKFEFEGGSRALILEHSFDSGRIFLIN